MATVSAIILDISYGFISELYGTYRQILKS